MNRPHTFLTAAALGTVILCGPVVAHPLAPAGAQGGRTILAQLGNGGPVGPGPNGQDNGAHTFGAPPSTLNPSGANGGAQPQGTSGIRPNSGATGGNGSKPAPMQANGVRKIN